MTYEDALRRYRAWRLVAPNAETVQVIETILRFHNYNSPICSWCLRPLSAHDPRCYLSGANRGTPQHS